MKKMYAHCAAATLVCVVTAVSSPVLQADAATDARLDSIERKLDSRGLLEMLSRVEQMQRDIQQLRGDIEVQTHTLEDIQRRSREQYLDIDRRLQQLETGQAGVASPVDPMDAQMPVTVMPPATPAPPVMTSTPVPEPTRAPLQTAPPAVQAGELAEYEQALAILREGNYDEATRAFNRFLANYPSSSYSDNANYWLGETYYVTRDFDRALATFMQLTENYPNSPKAPDSFLKTGYIYYEKQDWPAARQALDTVISGYPGTTAARLAADRLQRMKKDGH
ncbi:MAG: tol-pal system protein YbgF [Gammaproteobacteria bacterium]|jgi:tol-pal system protein YbgF